MVQYHEQAHTFNAPLPYITLAHNLRFPSPYSSHVLSSDVISRSFHTIPASNENSSLSSGSGSSVAASSASSAASPRTVVRTTRLVLKRGKMPAWAPAAVYKIGTSWVLEESECDLEVDGLAQGGQGKELRVRSRNLDHVNILEVFEWQTFREKSNDSTITESDTLSRVTSEFSFWPLRYRIEKFGLGRIPKASEKARAGLDLIAAHLLQPSTSKQMLSSGPLSPFPFEPIPSSLAVAVRARFDEARAAALALRRDEDATVQTDKLDSVQDANPSSSSSEFRGEPGKIWRERWRFAVKRGINNFRAKVCAATGLLCDSPTTER